METFIAVLAALLVRDIVRHAARSLELRWHPAGDLRITHINGRRIEAPPWVQVLRALAAR